MMQDNITMQTARKPISKVYMIIIIIVITSCHVVRTADRNIPDSSNVKPRGNIPEQIHLSLGSRVNDFIVMWATQASEECFVEYGTGTQSFTKVTGRIEELKVDSQNAARFVHRASLVNLKPDTQYWYYIVCSVSATHTDKFIFKVPFIGSQKQHKFLVLADVGTLTKSLPFLVHEVLNGGYEVVFHIGDIAYNLNGYGGKIGDEFMKKIDNFTARVPYMTTPGDHERFQDFYHYRYRFSMPNAPWPMPTDRLWYSIDIGHTHFISINTELVPPSRLSQLQFDWLKNDLINANKNRKATPWIIVMGHKPMYCTRASMREECDGEKCPLRDLLEDLFFEQGVDLYISGHKHCYERSWPMYKGKVFQTDTINPMAPIHIISGTTGYEYLVDVKENKPYWLAFAAIDGDKELYARLSVLNGTHLIWSLHAVINNEMIERVIVIQNRHGPFGKADLSAFSKILYQANRRDDLPAEPFYLVEDEPNYTFRRVLLYSVVIVLSLSVLAFLRSPYIRRKLRLGS